MIEYCGHLYNDDGKRLMDAFKQKCIDAPEPKNSKESKSVTSMFKFATQYVPGLARQMDKITLLEQNHIPWKWGKEEKMAFQSIKESIKHSGILCHPNPTGRYLVHSDSCQFYRGAALFQEFYDAKTGKTLYKLISF